MVVVDCSQDQTAIQKLVTNPTAPQATVSLGTPVFRDLEGNVVRSEILLPAFTSSVLIRD
jgi:hypothetical protein